MLLRDNLQPTDFADAVCRVSDWMPYEHYGNAAYRVWVCRCSNYWFQRHEWMKAAANQSEFEEWIFSGYSHNRQFPQHMKPAPNLEDI